MAEIFISYAREDFVLVETIASALELEGFEIWWDRRIEGGQDFGAAIDAALENAKIVLVVWSENSVQSRWVKEEAEVGLQRECLLPCQIDDATIPLGFRRIQTLQLQDKSPPTESSRWPNLIEELNAKAVQSSIIRKKNKSGNANLPWHANIGALLNNKASLSAAFLLVAAFIFAAWQWGWPEQSDSNNDLADVSGLQPTVIGVFPSNAFGPAQRRGLHLALEAKAGNVGIIDLQAPIDAMKRREAPEIMEALEKALASRNVVAVVGPSITEFTKPFLKTIERSGRKPAVLLTTAGPRQDIGWTEVDLPIFRVGSSIDERAKDFSDFAETAIAQNQKIIFLIETMPNQATNSYGQIFFNHIRKNINGWEAWFRQGKISRVFFERGKSVESLLARNNQRIFNEPNTVILMLGIGGDYQALASHFYSKTRAPKQASMGAWMSAYATDEKYRAENFQFGRLFDISDVYDSQEEQINDPYFAPFFREYGPLTPTRRDEAVSYDSGIVIEQALQKIKGKKSSQAVVDVIRNSQFSGITGQIFFSDDGRNQGPAGGIAPLNLIYYDDEQKAWRRLDGPSELLLRHSGNDQKTSVLEPI